MWKQQWCATSKSNLQKGVHSSTHSLGTLVLSCEQAWDSLLKNENEEWIKNEEWQWKMSGPWTSSPNWGHPRPVYRKSTAECMSEPNWDQLSLIQISRTVWQAYKLMRKRKCLLLNVAEVLWWFEIAALMWQEITSAQIEDAKSACISGCRRRGTELQPAYKRHGVLTRKKLCSPS